jgi:hypothetical protein
MKNVFHGKEAAGGKTAIYSRERRKCKQEFSVPNNPTKSGARKGWNAEISALCELFQTDIGQ